MNVDPLKNRFPGGSFNEVHLHGFLSGLSSEEERLKALREAVRLAGKDAVIFVSEFYFPSKFSTEMLERLTAKAGLRAAFLVRDSSDKAPRLKLKSIKREESREVCDHAGFGHAISPLTAPGYFLACLSRLKG